MSDYDEFVILDYDHEPLKCNDDIHDDVKDDEYLKCSGSSCSLKCSGTSNEECTCTSDPIKCTSDPIKCMSDPLKCVGDPLTSDPNKCDIICDVSNDVTKSYPLQEWVDITSPYHLTIKDIVTMKDGDILTLICLDRNISDIVHAKHKKYLSPARYFKNGYKMTITKIDKMDKNINVIGGVWFVGQKIPTSKFEFDIEYRPNCWLPLHNGLLRQSSNKLFDVDISWKSFPETTRIGWRGPAIPINCPMPNIKIEERCLSCIPKHVYSHIDFEYDLQIIIDKHSTPLTKIIDSLIDDDDNEIDITNIINNYKKDTLYIASKYRSYVYDFRSLCVRWFDIIRTCYPNHNIHLRISYGFFSDGFTLLVTHKGVKP